MPSSSSENGEVIKIASVKERMAVFKMNAVTPQSRRNIAQSKQQQHQRPRRRMSGLAPNDAWKSSATTDFFATDWQADEWKAFCQQTPTEKDASEQKARQNLQSVLAHELGKPVQTNTYNGARVHYVQAVSNMRPPVEEYQLPSDTTSAQTTRQQLAKTRSETLRTKQRYNTLKGAWDQYDVVAQDKFGHADDDDEFLQQQWDMQQDLDEVEVELAQEWSEFVDKMHETRQEFQQVFGEPEIPDTENNNNDNDEDQKWIDEARAIKQNHKALSQRQSRRRQWRAKIEQRQKDVSVSRLNVESDSDEDNDDSKNNHRSTSDDDLSNEALEDSFMEKDDSDDEEAPRIVGGEIQADFVAPTSMHNNSDDDSDENEDETTENASSASRTSRKASKKKKSKRILQAEESTSSMMSSTNNDSSSTIPGSSKGKKKKSKKKSSSSTKNKVPTESLSDSKFHRPPSLVVSKSDDEASDDENFWKIGEGHMFKAWMHQPRKVKINGSQITIKVPEKTDCWRKTRHNWIMDNAPFVSGIYEEWMLVQLALISD